MIPRVKRAARIYSSREWRLVRQIVLERDGYRCTVCGILVSGRGEARVDHIRRVSDGGTLFDPNNLRTLCALHDNEAHREKGSGSAVRQERFELIGCDVSGIPFNRQVHHS